MMTLANNTPGAARLCVVQASALCGAIVVSPGGALHLDAGERYTLRVSGRGPGFAYERSLELAGGTAHVVALRQGGAGRPPFEVELEGPRVPFAVSCENTTPGRMAFCLTRALGDGPFALSAVVLLAQWESARMDTGDDYEVSAIVGGYRTAPLRLARLEGRLEVVVGREPDRPELRSA